VIEATGLPAVVPGGFLMTIDPLGRFLYSATYLTGELFGFRIDAGTCALAPIGSSSVAVGASGLHGIAFDPQGRFLVVTATSDLSTRVFAVNQATGAITATAMPYPGGGRWVMFDPAGDHILVADGDEGVWSFTVDAMTGALTEAPGAPFSAGPPVWFVVTDAAGRFAYASDQSRLLGFRIDPATGALDPLAITLPAADALAMGVFTTSW
jgi:6-phosphogluconolactonase